VLNAQYQLADVSSSSGAVGVLDLADAKARLELLRKGCCHPQVLDATLARHGRTGASGSGHAHSRGHKHLAPNLTAGKTAAKAEAAGPRPLDEIMVAKVEQSRLQCEETQRGLLFHLFSMAGATALQAQCCLLSLSPYDAFNAREAGDTACRHLVRAHCTYRLALSLLQCNRASTALIGMAKIHSEEGAQLMVVRSGVGPVSTTVTGVRVPVAQEGLHLLWQVPCGGDVSAAVQEEATAAGNTDATEQSKATVQWRPVDQHSLSAVPFDNENCVDDDVPPTAAGFGGQHLTTRMTFNTSKRITGMTVSNAVPDSSELHAHFRARTSLSAGDSYVVLLQPAVVALQVAVGASDVYVDVCTVQLPLRETAGRGIGATGIVHGDRGLHRSKRWRVRVLSLHSHCCVVRHGPGQHGRGMDCAWLPVAHLGAFRNNLASTTTTGTQLRLTVQLQETALDTDALQELHACHNISTLTEVLHSADQPHLYQRYRQVLLHTEPMLGIPETDVTAHVGAVLRRLQNISFYDQASSGSGSNVRVAEDVTGSNHSERAAVIEREVNCSCFCALWAVVLLLFFCALPCTLVLRGIVAVVCSLRSRIRGTHSVLIYLARMSYVNSFWRRQRDVV
jgi:hypothetical protein